MTAVAAAPVPNVSRLSLAELRDELLAEPRACLEKPELFFASESESPAQRWERERAAVALCAACPVRWLCFEYAARERPEAGVWAGFTAAELNGWGAA